MLETGSQKRDQRTCWLNNSWKYGLSEYRILNLSKNFNEVLITDKSKYLHMFKLIDYMSVLINSEMQSPTRHKRSTYGFHWFQIISNDIISIWNHLKSMKSLGLKPSVLFETTSPCRFHWFHFNLKGFHWFQIISNDFISIWNHLKSMKSLGLKPSVLFETTSPCRFHWFHFNLKGFHWFQIISNDFISIWNHLKSMKSLGLKPSVLFETTSPCRFHLFHFNLKGFHWFQIISNNFNSIWNQWNQPREVVSNRTDGFNLEISLISNDFKSKWNHLKLFEINEIRTSTSCDGLETAFHWFQMISNQNEIIWNQWNRFLCVSVFEINETISDGNWNKWNRDFIGR